MNEIIPVLAGIGLAVLLPATLAARRWVPLLLATILGGGISMVTGEWNQSLGYALLDAAQIVLAFSILRRLSLAWTRHAAAARRCR